MWCDSALCFCSPQHYTNKCGQASSIVLLANASNVRVSVYLCVHRQVLNEMRLHSRSVSMH